MFISGIPGIRIDPVRPSKSGQIKRKDRAVEVEDKEEAQLIEEIVDDTYEKDRATYHRPKPKRDNEDSAGPRL